MINLLFKKLKRQNFFLPHHLLLIVLFSIGFYLYAPYSGYVNDIENFSSFFTTFYFTTVTHFTVGFGDVAPESNVLRFFTIIHCFMAFALFNL